MSEKKAPEKKSKLKLKKEQIRKLTDKEVAGAQGGLRRDGGGTINTCSSCNCSEA